MRWLYVSLPVGERQRLSTLRRGRLPQDRGSVQGWRPGNTHTHMILILYLKVWNWFSGSVHEWFKFTGFCWFRQFKITQKYMTYFCGHQMSSPAPPSLPRKPCTCGTSPSRAPKASRCLLEAPPPARPSPCGWRSASGAEPSWPCCSSRSPVISGRKTRGERKTCQF